ncbi:MAG: hypothetical protein GY746_04410 [Gammaproteobacteria bacterium]|nr:hypothetical protein [Gammaproteobacteria bacterium]
MDENLCKTYKRIIRQEFHVLFTQYEFKFANCKVFRSGEYCNISFTSPYGKLWISFEHGSPAVMIGHPRASLDDVSLGTGIPYWFGLGILISYFGKVPVSQLFAEIDNPSPDPHYDSEEERTTIILRKLWKKTEPYCAKLFTFFQEEQFDQQVAELDSWRKSRSAEFEKLTNERYQQMRNQNG